MVLENPSLNCFRKFKGLQLTFQVLDHTILEQIYDCPARSTWACSAASPGLP
jgi:hypothetical protein